MKRMYFMAAIAAMCVMLLASCYKGKLEQAEGTIDSLLQANNMTEQELADYVSLVNDVSASMDAIMAAEDQISDATKEGSSVEQRNVLKDKVNQMASILQEQKDRVAELEAKLNASGTKNAKLQSIITMMKSQIAAKDNMIAELRKELDNKNADITALTGKVDNLTNENTSLNTTIKGQKEEIQGQKEVITSQTNKINEAFVKIATKKELKDAGLLEGGFLQKKKVNINGVDKKLFQQVDIRTYKTVTINSKSPKIKSQMPEDSYTLVSNGTTTTLTIIDAERFWSITNFLIIQL
ncbi:MAG: hypothetical protein KBS94_08330 [Prevotella sp.]|nr:hypothetical protein [Candidatus Equicola faecalis]